MISKVTVCPFEDTDHLAQCAETGIEDINPKLQEILNSLRTSNFGPFANKIDDLCLEMITAAQNETIRNTVCLFCDHDILCHPPK